MENKEFMKEWKRNSIRIGTPTNIIAAFTSFIPVIWLCLKYDCWPDPKVVLDFQLRSTGMVVMDPHQKKGLIQSILHRIL